jgi:hypothetical protein
MSEFFFFINNFIFKIKKMTRCGWYTSVIPDIQEAEVGGFRSEASLGENMRLYLKNKNKLWLK